ncbi:OmpA family protein [Diaphorobacter sp.]|uniref:OmpA family protein n=1 Tax=Diaphorobacter sp. TaxID=1934310 RepID=UPI003D0DEA81
MSFNTSDDDKEQRVVLGFLFALIALVVSAVVGLGFHKRMPIQAPAAATTADAPAAEAAAPGVVITEDGSSVVVEGGVVKFFFATGKADLAAGASEALADVVKGVLEGGKTALVSGFHDATGDAALNAELAKQRALAVRDALKALGVAEDKIELKKPEVMQGSGSNAEARRVEVILAP